MVTTYDADTLTPYPTFCRLSSSLPVVVHVAREPIARIERRVSASIVRGGRSIDLREWSDSGNRAIG